MKILLLEDDFALREIVKDELERLGYRVYDYADGVSAMDSLFENTYDLFLLDINVPGINGYEFLKEIRETGNSSPAIFISSYSDIDHLSKGYEYGCNDYIRKPFSLKELELRVKQQLKIEVIKASEKILELNLDYKYDTDTNTLLYMDKPVKLNQKEKLLIDFLVKNRGRTVSSDEIVDYVWDEYIDMNSLRVLIYKLRKKLQSELIENVKGIGYQIS
ncbi:MAG: response regulator transcription factor [Campylobacterales bacterium]|nr:response regulator transcription factor [Campylobacterales bacterium]